jgi:predicted amidohydrolase YtcJ
MKIRLLCCWLLGAVTLVLTGARSAERSADAPADSIVVHPKVYTMNAKQPWAQAVAIHEGRIIAVGGDAEIQKLSQAGTEVIDAGGRLVLPGFVDCHIHFLDGALSLARANLEGAKDAAGIQQKLREYAAQHPGTDWIRGRGWDYAMFGAEALPHKKYLDSLFPDRPVFLEGYEGHTYWANSKALAMAGISKATPDPPNGAIVHDLETGEPTGALKESAAELVAKILPKITRGEKMEALRAGMKWANEHGLTRVHSAGGDFEELALFDELRRRSEQTLRFYIAYFLNPPVLRAKDIEAIETARKKYHDEWIDTGAVKMMVDGVIESHTAGMLEPYSDDPSTKGKLFWEPQKYDAAVVELDQRGLQLFTHAIGDYAVRTALDAYEKAERANHTHDRRPRIEHIETITAKDIPRFGQLGVIAGMQPLHSYPNADTLNVWARNLGPDRAGRAWVWKSIAKDGGHLVFGSDWPVVTLNPWEGVQTAVTRQTSEGQPEAGFVPEQRLSVDEAIAAYTLGAAYAGRREKSEGSIEAGKRADLIVLSQNVLQVDARRLSETKTVMTMVGGRVVYRVDAK